MLSIVAGHDASQKIRIWGASAAAILLLPAAIAWTAHVSAKGSTVASNVHLAGVDVSGLTAVETAALVEARAEDLMASPIRIETGGEPIVAKAAELGFTYDRRTVLDQVLSARHTGGAVGVFLAWVSSPFKTIEVEDGIIFDPGEARRRLLAEPRRIVSDAVEPTLTMNGTNYLYATPGSTGLGIDVNDLVTTLGSLDLHSAPLKLTAGQISIEPTITDARIEEIADRLNSLTAGGMEVLVGSSHETLTTAELRRHLRTETTGGRVRYEFDVPSLQGELERALAKPVGSFVSPVMDIVDGDIVVVTPGEAPPICCSRESVGDAAEGILAGGSGPWHLEPKSDSDPEVAAWADGTAIVDKIAEFATPHSCCKPRVKNIQRIADIVRGIYMVPGQSLSLNRVAPRTRANGFVADGAIRFGRLTDEVGGGVSQFATTMFNTAYLAGLDFQEYRSHSIYFKRYPFGREATISTPKPDLVITNTTDYPVLIWTSYDSRSITVTMYSTKHIEVAELGQRINQMRECTHVETDRRRTYPDGRVVVDTFEAVYRPAEGFDCNGARVEIPSEDDAEEGENGDTTSDS